MDLNYLYDYGLDSLDVEKMKNDMDDVTYSELALFEGIVRDNVKYIKDFGVSNFASVLSSYPEIFLRDAESFRNIFSKFDRDDLIQKVEKNPAVFKKMVEFVDNN